MKVSEGNSLPSMLKKLDSMLLKAYGPKKNDRDEDAVTSLVHTILSQNTTDRTSDRAFAALRERFSDWEAVISADVSEVADSIRQGGLADQKAASIQSVLRRIKMDRGEISLEFLKELAEGEVMDYLTSLKGVGPKTAACTMLFALGKKAFPVDTHVHRLANRLGIVTTRSAEETQRVMTEAADIEICYSLHLNMIQHGRQRCHARAPVCSGCPLFSTCKSAAV